jgi:hypothetical protein
MGAILTLSTVSSQKRIHFQLSVSASDTESTDSDEWDSHRATEQLVTFEEWFGVAIEELPAELQALRPKHRIMVHKQPPCRTLTKAFPATVYTSTAFPLSVRYAFSLDPSSKAGRGSEIYGWNSRDRSTSSCRSLKCSPRPRAPLRTCASSSTRCVSISSSVFRRRP